MIGGPCTECGDPVQRELVWIGNAWDFKGTSVVTETENCTSIQTDGNALIEAVEQHIKYLHS
jgi:hypothetical protein